MSLLLSLTMALCIQLIWQCLNMIPGNPFVLSSFLWSIFSSSIHPNQCFCTFYSSLIYHRLVHPPTSASVLSICLHVIILSVYLLMTTNHQLYQFCVNTYGRKWQSLIMCPWYFQKCVNQATSLMSLQALANHALWVHISLRVDRTFVHRAQVPL